MTHTHATYNEAVHAALHLLADDMGYEIPAHADIAQERTCLRALMNMRSPSPCPTATVRRRGSCSTPNGSDVEP